MKTIKNFKTYSAIWKFAKKYKIGFLTSFIANSSIGIANLAYTFLFALLLDEIIYNNNFDFFSIILISYIIIFICQNIMRFISQNCWIYCRIRLVFDAKRKVFGNVLNAKVSYLTNMESGNLIQSIVHDTENFFDIMHNNTNGIIASIVNYLITFVFIALINFKIAALLFVAVPFSIYITSVFAHKIQSQSWINRLEYGKFVSWFYDILSGIREIKLLAAEKIVLKKFVNFRKKNIRLDINHSAFGLKSTTINQFISLFI